MTVLIFFSHVSVEMMSLSDYSIRFMSTLRNFGDMTRIYIYVCCSWQKWRINIIKRCFRQITQGITATRSIEPCIFQSFLALILPDAATTLEWTTTSCIMSRIHRSWIVPTLDSFDIALHDQLQLGVQGISLQCFSYKSLSTASTAEWSSVCMGSAFTRLTAL